MKCCICGTVRNCEPYLNKIFENMEKIGTLFEDYRIILYYDDSSDNTLNILKEYIKKNDKFLLFSNKYLLQYRTHRLAAGRNLCIKKIQNNFSDYEYFIMMDCDDKCAYNIRLKLLNAYLHRYDWDALSFNHPAGYYDSWALSKRPYVVSCHHFNDGGVGVRQITKIIDKTSKHKLIPCLSAFNGFSIYRTTKFIDCSYDGRFRLDYIPKSFIEENIRFAGRINFTQNKEDCEHRHFHFESVFKNGARIRISPLCIFTTLNI
jgi:glycosyltransferase involved in cell wall biosynthesis